MKIVAVVGLSLVAVAGNYSYAQFSLSKIVGNNNNGAAVPAMDADATQDQLVRAFVVADVETLTGKSKIAEALGLKDEAAELAAEAIALNSGATQSDDLKKADSISSNAQQAIDTSLLKSASLSDDSRAIFAEGLGHLGIGTVQTVRLKDSATQFQNSARAQLASASVLEKLNVTKKLAAGTYVAMHLPGHIVSLGSGLRNAMSFAQDHGIKVPPDATVAMNGF